MKKLIIEMPDEWSLHSPCSVACPFWEKCDKFRNINCPISQGKMHSQSGKAINKDYDTRMDYIAGRKKGKRHYGRPLTIGRVTIEDGTIFIDHPNDRERFNIGRLEGKSGQIIFKREEE